MVNLKSELLIGSDKFGSSNGATPELAKCEGQRLGVLPDSKGIYPRLTARENIAYYGRIYGLRGAELDARVEGLIDELELRKVAER